MAVALGLGARLLLKKLRPAISQRMVQLTSAKTLKNLAVNTLKSPVRVFNMGARIGKNILNPSLKTKRKDNLRPSVVSQELNKVDIISYLSGLALVGGFFAVFEELSNLMKKGISLDQIKDALNLKQDADLETTALYLTMLAHALRNPEIAQKIGLNKVAQEPQNKGFNLEPPAPKL